MTRATLGDVALLADAPVTWPDLPGVYPAEAEFSVRPQDVPTLLEARGPLKLKVEPGGSGTAREWSNLWVLRESPGPSPHQARVHVVDRRWFWPYCHIIRAFNMRRRTGFYRIAAQGTPELARVEESFAYARYSLLDPDKGRTSSADAVLDILEELSRWEEFNGGTKFNVTYTSLPPGSSFENCLIDSPGHLAVQQFLAYLPGLDIRLKDDGTVDLFDRSVGVEEVVKAVGPEIVGGGHVITVSHRNEAPSRIEVLFTIEAEVRFDFIERGLEETVVADPEEEQRDLKPVIPLPDYTLNVGGQTEVQGTLVGWNDYLAALPALPSGARLTDKMVRAAFMPFMDLWTSILRVGTLVTDSDWAARVAAIQQYYRRLVRLPRGWHDRVIRWQAVRVATVNQATGARAPAVVYADHAILGSQRSQLRDYSDGNALVYAINVAGYRTTIDGQARPSPAFVRLYDPDIGVVAWDFQLDPYRVYESILPSQIEAETGPGYGKPDADGRRPITFDSVKAPGTGAPRLASAHKAALILTATPAAPNNSRQFFRLTVFPDDCADRMSPAALAAAKAARGPRLQIRISPGVETARVRWDDTRAADIEALFGLGPLSNGGGNIDGLVVNSYRKGAGEVEPGYSASPGASLDEIAKSWAARVWASYADHPHGQMTGALSSAIIDGWTSSLAHTLYPDGTATTLATFPDRLPQLDFAALLDPGTRAIVQREVYRK